MTRISKNLFIAAATVAMSGVAIAQDAPADPAAGGDATGGAAATEPAAPPAGGPAAPEAAAPAKKMTIGADLAFVLPLSDYSDAADFAIGGLGRFEYAVNDLISATARVGYIWNSTKTDGFSLGMIPVMVGGSYKIGTSGLSAYGELGLTNIRVSVDAGGISASDSKTKFAVGAGVGYQKDKIKARAGFWMPGSLDNGNGGTTTLMSLMASVGYDFVSL